MKKNILLSSFCVSIASAVSVLAQPTEVQQVNSTTRVQEQQQGLLKYETGENAPELYPEENKDLGTQRILRLKPRHYYFEGVADSQYFYSSNARLSHQPDESALWVNTAEAVFTPPDFKLLNQDMSTRAGVRMQWYNYGLGTGPSLDVFDFNAQIAYIEESFSPIDHWRFDFGVEAMRLVNQPSYKQFYREVAPTWGAMRFFPVGIHKTFVMAYKGSYHLSDATTTFLTSINDRTEHRFTLAYNQELIPNLVVQPYYQFQYSHFMDASERNDYQNTVGLSFTYQLCQNASVRTFLSYEKKSTDQPLLTSDYEKFDIGLGVNLDIKF